MTARLALLFAFALTLAHAAPLPFDENADAKADLERALAAAKASGTPVLVIFGANWCPDCRALDKALSTGKNAELVCREFKVVKVDVGQFDRNLDLAARYGNPVRKGIPAAVVLSPQGELLYATRLGELADARHMSDTGIYDFFKGVVQQAQKGR